MSDNNQYPGQPTDPYNGQNPGQQVPDPNAAYGQPPQYQDPNAAHGQPPQYQDPNAAYNAAPGAYPPPAAPYVDPNAYQQPGAYSAPGQVDIGEAFRWSWAKLTDSRNLAPLVGGYAAIVGATVAIYFVFFFIGGLIAGTEGNLFGLLFMGIGYIVALAGSLYGSVLLYNAVIAVNRGYTITFGQFFKVNNLGAAIGTVLLVGLGTAVGSVLCVIPGLIFAVASIYSLFFTIDKGLSPVEAIKASIELARANIGPTVIAALLASVVAGAGSIVCGVGIFFTTPLSMLFLSFYYRKLIGEQVAA